MERMEDKKFDQFFKDQLSNAEVEAPAMLWNKIEEEITPKPVKKRRLPVYWMAAAVAVIALSATLVFHTEEKIQLQNSGLVLVKPQDNVDINMELPDRQVENSLSTVEDRNVDNVDNSVDNPKSTKRMLAMQPSVENDHLSTYTSENGKETSSIDAIAVVQKEDVVTPEQEVLIASVDLPDETQHALVAENEEEDRKAIRNVGDLVNFVVDKVDKRQEKLIQFNTDDDDNSSLVSINIGILKFNKKNRERR